MICITKAKGFGDGYKARFAGGNAQFPEAAVGIRPVTLRLGTNRVIGGRPEAILPAWRKLMRSGFARKRTRIPGWDGRAAERIVKIVVNYLERGLRQDPA